MPTRIFVNLPVKDLKKSNAFFKSLGYSFDSRFTDDTATCMVIDDNIRAMLLTHEKFGTFTPHPICDATQSTEVLLALELESRAAVDEMVRKAVAAGGTTVRPPRDHGFMYEHGFQDLDGHIWELLWLNPSAMRQETSAAV